MSPTVTSTRQMSRWTTAHTITADRMYGERAWGQAVPSRRALDAMADAAMTAGYTSRNRPCPTCHVAMPTRGGCGFCE